MRFVSCWLAASASASAWLSVIKGIRNRGDDGGGGGERKRGRCRKGRDGKNRDDGGATTGLWRRCLRRSTQGNHLPHSGVRGVPLRPLCQYPGRLLLARVLAIASAWGACCTAVVAVWRARAAGCAAGTSALTCLPACKALATRSGLVAKSTSIAPSFAGVLAALCLGRLPFPHCLSLRHLPRCDCAGGG